MVKLFDSTYILGSILVVVAVAIAIAAVTRDELPIVGTGVGALLAVGIVGMAACAVAGIGQAPTLGWTAPGILVGTVLGVAALAIVLAGVLGWTGLLAPVAQLVQSGSTPVPAARTATVALAAVIVVKWFIGTAMAVVAR
ncbi:MAG TPA: hypothetical protein VEG29_00145 [Candidatus Binatia bacterium]|nr:hypothetical protein [Candidatus Binatia bacterium]